MNHSGLNADEEEIAENPAAERFYSGAVARILRSLLILWLVTIAPVGLRYGWKAAAGFALGGAISYVNFRWLAGAVEGVADRIVEGKSRERGGAIVTRFVLRYLLIAVAAYVIFTGWSGAARGLLGGLCLPAAAMLGEAGYETYAALRRGW